MRQQARQIVAEFVTRIDALLRGRSANVWDVVSEDLEIEIVGTTPLSGVYRGRADVDEILAPTIKRLIVSGSVSIVELVAGDDRAGALLLLRATTRTGRTYNTAGDPAGCYFHIANGRVARVRFFPDTTEVETVLYGKRIHENAVPTAEQEAAP